MAITISSATANKVDIDRLEMFYVDHALAETLIAVLQLPWKLEFELWPLTSLCFQLFIIFCIVLRFALFYSNYYY